MPKCYAVANSVDKIDFPLMKFNLQNKFENEVNYLNRFSPK